ncbi:hypothetical protein D0Z00_000026 [Geotrichum galactomycetum]|uniref:Uncharacterized protein n=1 Tax=Geotrichum galactomycetum TaxID=27317 RepID=A0ACB6VAQ5_9ASCO|nr:hypothetical protein D0Z00_000026 [Geotrichum candidum]
MQQQQAVNGSNAMATAVSNSYLQHRKGDSSISASPRQKTPISMSQYIHDPSKGQVGTILPQQQQFQAQIYYNTDNSTGIVADPSQLRQGSTDQNMLQRQQSQLNVSNHNSPSTSTQIVSPVVQTPTQYAQSSPVPQQLQRSPQTANGMRTNSGMVNANMISAQQMAMMNRNMTSQQQAVTAAYYKSQQQNGAAAFQQQQLLQQQQFAQQAAMGMATPQMVSQNAALQSQLLMQQQQQSQQQQQQQQQQQEMIQRNQLQQQTQYQQQIPQADFNKARLQQQHSTPLNNNNIAVNNVMNRATPVARSDSNPDLMPPPSGTPKIRKSQPPQSATPTLPQQQPAATSGPTLPSKPLLRLPKDESGKYIPKRRKLEYGYKGGSNIYELNRFGADIDSLVPDFPLFQELGSIEISTLIMALKSLIPGEVRQALDKLALLSSNPSVPIVLADCPELITALGELGLDLLNSLKANRVSNTVDVMTGDAPGDELKDDEEDGKDLVTKIFEAYRSWDESNEEIVVQVDDITGETMGEDLEIQTASDALEKVISEKSLDENGIPISSSKSTSSSLEDEYSAKTTIGFHHYDTLFELSKDEVENLNPQAGINKGKLSSFWQEALVDRFLCVCLIIRNLSFNEHNQSVIVNDEATLNFLLSVTRALALDGDKLFKSFSAVRRWFSLQKDLITLYGNLGLYIKIPSLVDALVILLLILSFSPEESPYHKAANGIEFELDFLEYEPTKHRYLGCAIDAIAKMITRDEPNKQFFKAIFNYKPSCDGGASNSNGAGGNNDGSDSVVIDKKFQVLYSKLVLLHPYELLTRTFALTIAALPRIDYKVIPKALELRRALLQQSLLVTELIIVDILDDPGLAADWTSASNGVITNTLLRTAFVLGAIYNPVAAAAAAAAAAHPHHHYQQQQVETHPFERITVRCINILTLLGEKAMLLPPATEKQKPPQAKSVTLASQQYSKRPLAPRANVGLPDVENVLSALLISTMNQTVVKKLCWFLEAGYNYVFSTSTPSAPPVLVKKKKTINGTTVNND